jgi:hypothetical protein
MRMAFPLRLIPLLWALASTMGCAQIQLITVDRPLKIGPDQGIIVVHVDSDVEIRRLRLSGYLDVVKWLREGTHLMLAVIPAGSYRWTSIQLYGPGAIYYVYEISNDPNWSFEVRPGQINYTGQIIIRGSTESVYNTGRMRAWNVNRAAIALEGLRETYPKLLAAHPLVNARTKRDDFLDHYQRVSPLAARSKPEGSTP